MRAPRPIILAALLLAVACTRSRHDDSGRVTIVPASAVVRSDPPAGGPVFPAPKPSPTPSTPPAVATALLTTGPKIRVEIGIPMTTTAPYTDPSVIFRVDVEWMAVGHSVRKRMPDGTWMIFRLMSMRVPSAGTTTSSFIVAHAANAVHSTAQTIPAMENIQITTDPLADPVTLNWR